MKCLTYIDQIRASFYRISCWTDPCIYKKAKELFLTLSISRQNPFIRTHSTVRHARMHCFFLFSVGTLPSLSTSSPYGKEVVQNIIIKMCFYDLHISSNAQPSILICNHKKKKKKKIDRELLLEIKKKIKKPKWIYNS